MLEKSIILERLKKRTIIDPITGCWLWQGALNAPNGHGVIRLSKPGPKDYVHRLSLYITINLPLDSEFMICHVRECPNKNCWNPEHLYLGNSKSNVHDAIALGTMDPGAFNRNKTHCPSGHEYNEQNTYLWNDERRCKICRRTNQIED
jgi:hypothetical protein